MQLGKLVWKLELTESEKQRISDLLSEQGGIHRSIFNQYVGKANTFSSISKRMQRKIPGFRPMSPQYRSRAIANILQDLSANRARMAYWRLYQHTIAEYIESEMPAFNQLMRDIEIDAGNDEQAAGASSILLESVCDHAKDYSIHDKDVRLVYELWPFERHDDIERQLRKCPKFDRFKAVDTSIAALRKNIHAIEAEVSESVPDIVKEELDKRDNEGMIRNSLQKFTEEYQEEIKQRIEPITTKFDNLEAKLNGQAKNTEFLETQTKTAHVALEKVTSDELALFGKKLEKLEGDIQSLKNQDSLVAGGLPCSASMAQHSSSVFRKMQNHGLVSPSGSVSEDVFIHTFINTCISRGLPYSPGYLRTAHALLKASPVVTVADSSIVDIWLDVLGWGASVLKIAASPIWSSITDWKEGTDHLFNELHMPSILYIYDYDSGLMEGYLEPVLRVWSESGFGRPTDKLYLVSSSLDDKHRSMSLRTPIVWLDLVENEVEESVNSSITAAVNSGQHLNNGIGITPECFLTWSSDHSPLLPNAKGFSIERSHENLINVLKELEIQFSMSLNRMIYHTCEMLSECNIGSKSIYLSCLKAIVLPWVVGNYGEQRAKELKAHIDSLQ